MNESPISNEREQGAEFQQPTRKERLLPMDPGKTELANSISHAVGIVLGILFLVLLMIQQASEGNPLGMVAYAIYGACFILLFSASTLYHAISHPTVKRVFRVLDHVSIFFFIAGSYTPPILLLLEGTRRMVMLSVVWIIAILGTVFQSITIAKDLYQRLKPFSILLYLLMGWIGLFMAKPAITLRRWPFFVLILVGGLLYSFGTIFYRRDDHKYNHFIWHLFVLAAAVAHFIAYYFFL